MQSDVTVRNNKLRCGGLLRGKLCARRWVMVRRGIVMPESRMQDMPGENSKLTAPRYRTVYPGLEPNWRYDAVDKGVQRRDSLCTLRSGLE